jgi:transcriptional regulator with XRE-family HTH domain
MRDVPPPLLGKVIGARLKELRRDAEMSQREVGLLAGIHRPIICRIERGQHTTSFETVCRYAAALGLVSADVFVCLDPTWPTTAEVLRAA